MKLAHVAVLLLALIPAVRAAGRGEHGPVYPVQVMLTDRTQDLATLTTLDIDVDAVNWDRARCYVIDKEVEKLRALGFVVERIADTGRIGWERAQQAAGAPAPLAPLGSMPTTYHTYETLTSELQSIANTRPDLTRLYSLGQSVQGRTLWAMKVTDNPGASEDEPAVRFMAAIHGDEVVGKELLIQLIHHLLDNYGTDARITNLVNNTEIWIMPSANPDGTALGQRYNANDVDLNRNFPDQFVDNNDTTTGREPETAAFMNWGFAHSVNHSLMFHGGELVANYPYDGTANGNSYYATAPDDISLVSLSRTYADHNPSMFANNSDASFWNGICNGADWYVVRGGQQDWNYVYRGTWDITMEIGTKWPDGSTLPSYWNENLESMLEFAERAQEGVRGVVTDSVTGAPLRTTLKVQGNLQPSYGDPDAGDYHRLIMPGTYNLEISAPGHVTELLNNFVVPVGPAARRDIALEPTQTDLQPVSYTILDSGNGFLDAGETTDMAVVLRNTGAYATNPSGVLIPIGYSTTVPRNTATYPAIAVGASAQSKSPHYQVSLSPSAPAGTKAGFVVKWTASGRSGVSEPFFVPAGARTCTTVSSTGGALPVPDRTTKTWALTFTNAVDVDEVNCYVNITHPYKSDLVVTLVSPSGTPVALHDHTGGSGANIVGWYDSQIAPYEPLSRFNGEAANGTWTLKVTDTVPANSGTINSWQLEVCGRPLEARPPEMTLRSVTKRAGKVVLEWWPYPGLTSYRVYRGTNPASAASFANVTGEDPITTDTTFEDAGTGALSLYLITGVSPRGESAWGAYGR